MPIVKPTQAEIDEVLNRCADAFDHGTMWPGMNYEQGVQTAIEWLLGYTDDDPMEEYVYYEER